MINTREATAEQITEAGIEALVRELGAAGMARFIQQFELGEGDYVQERQAWAEATTVDALVAEAMRMRRAPDRSR